MKEINFFFKSPFFLFPWQLRQSLSYRLRFFLAYLVPLDVDVTGNITPKLCEVWSEFQIFCTLVTMATAAIFICSTPPPQSCHTLRWIFLQSFMKFDERNPTFFKTPLFVSMATAAKFVQPIPIFLSYIVPLDVDAVPINVHQFLFGE